MYTIVCKLLAFSKTEKAQRFSAEMSFLRLSTMLFNMFDIRQWETNICVMNIPDCNFSVFHVIITPDQFITQDFRNDQDHNKIDVPAAIAHKLADKNSEAYIDSAFNVKITELWNRIEFLCHYAATYLWELIKLNMFWFVKQFICNTAIITLQIWKEKRKNIYSM